MNVFSDIQSQAGLPGTASLSRLLLVFGGLALFVLVGQPRLAGAQDAQAVPFSPESKIESLAPTWRAHFGQQAGRLLEEDSSEAVRETVLRALSRVADRRPTVDLSATIRPLLHILKTDSDPQRRLMAIQILHNIGHEQVEPDLYRSAMKQVASLAEEAPSQQVRRAATACLRIYQSMGESTTTASRQPERDLQSSESS